MKIAVLGLWHLGCVISACMAAAGHDVTGIDENEETVLDLTSGKPPVFEPGLADLVKSGLDSGRMRFSTRFADARDADLVWIAYDTPVDQEDHADVQFVEERIAKALPELKGGVIVLISSQVPVGFTDSLSRAWLQVHPESDVRFAYSPENLRLGKAIQAFTKPDRVVIGCGKSDARAVFESLFEPFTSNLIWMSPASAEMTKHALNAFFALSVSFINEIAVICEQTGADAREVERGLKSEARIGEKAYLSPGGAFAGGTLARDVAYLEEQARLFNSPSELLSAIRASNEAHKKWAARRLQQRMQDLKGRVVAVLGLTYKPGTDTLRRSSSVELCQWLVSEGSIVQAHDPLVKKLPDGLKDQISLKATAKEALEGASAMVVATECPEFRQISAHEIISLMKRPLVLDVNGFLSKTLGLESRIDYIAVGKK